MHLIVTLIFLYLLLIQTGSIHSILISKIINATYSGGSSFSKINLTTSDTCMCLCIDHPHCLSISIMKMPNNTFYCQLFATYPRNNSELSLSLASNVSIYTNRTLNSVYINNGTRLSNPTSLTLNSINPWIPVFKLYTGNNQSFLWLNSSNLTTLINIPSISINQALPHWFSILISQWNQLLYIPNQVAIAFIVNRTMILDFLIFNSSQSNITTWFSAVNLLSTQYWQILSNPTSLVSQTQIKSVYSDSDCIRSFNCNSKFSTSGCTHDFYGFFFVNGGYKDACIAATKNMSQIALPSIYYSPTTSYTNGDFSYFQVADSLMGFVR